jgi:antitoxin MazE
MNLVEEMELEAPEESGEELRSHLKTLLSQIKADSPRHEEIDLGIEGDELI